jgi:hypothetical protein
MEASRVLLTNPGCKQISAATGADRHRGRLQSARWRTLPPYSNHPIDAAKQLTNILSLRGSLYGDVIVGIFLIIVVGATGSFAYIVYADDLCR